MRKLLALSAFAVCLSCLSVRAVAQAEYTLVDLGAIGTKPDSYATRINNNGTVLGGFDDGNTRGSVWSATSGWSTVPLTPGYETQSLTGINDTGLVVGYASTPSGVGFSWSSSQGSRVLAAGGLHFYLASEANGWGEIVGGERDGGKAVLWHPDGTPESIGSGSGTSLNNSSVVTGDRRVDGRNVVYRWSKETGQTSLPTLPGDTDATAMRINNANQIVGFTATPSLDFDAVLWDADGNPMNLGSVFGSGGQYVAQSINDQGTVVGSCSRFGLKSWMWDSGHGMRDLSSLVDSSLGSWQLWSAKDINENGQICGFGMHEGNVRAFVLNPVPEPCTLLALAPVALLVRARRKTALAQVGK